jgi:uncharacterized damage-inducible protein DinB
MIRTINDFEHIWSREIEATQKLFKHLTDRSLSHHVNAEGRTLARLAWHIVTTIPEMMSKTGLTLAGLKPDDPVPATAREISKAYSTVAISLLEQVKEGWTDATLGQKDMMYGEQWTRSMTLTSLVLHQVHHRGQMTVVMRQAGLDIPGIYGPARQEWAAFGMDPPAV